MHPSFFHAIIWPGSLCGKAARERFVKIEEKRMTDIIIIGAGVLGCAIARELSFHQVSVTVLEKECDVAAATTGRNSAVVHAGFNNKTGSLMAKVCVEGNRMMEQLCRELDVPFKKTGKVLVAFDEEDIEILKRMIAQGEANGCEGLRLIPEEAVRELVPGVGGIGGMLSPNTGIIDPFRYCIALAENAAENGACFRFEEEVTAIRKKEEGFTVATCKGEYDCRVLINAAGLHADTVSAMAGVDAYHIYPCRGEYFILDKLADAMLPMPVYPAPKAGIGGLGVHLTPTVHGNILIGPSAEYIDEKENYDCTAEITDKLWREAVALMPALERKHIIGQYSGIRAKQAPASEGGYRDFVIREEPACPGLINLIGTESPGLTGSVPIARMVRDIAAVIIPLERKKEVNASHRFPPRFAELPEEEQERLIAEDPEYGEIICRCQRVTKREIRQAIENPLGARSLSAVKYRAWAMTGRCSGGYCLNRIADMLVREYGVAPAQITWRGSGSEMFSGEVK